MKIFHPVLLVVIVALAAGVLLFWFGCRLKTGASVPDPTSAEAASVSMAPPADTTPFKGKTSAIPGLIEAEHFDEGDEGAAYHDTSPENEGRGKSMRATGVDIGFEPYRDSGKYRLVSVKEGEWVNYTVRVGRSGTYAVEVAAATRGGEGGVFHLEFDGEDRSGPIQVPASTEPTIYRLFVKEGLRLEAGTQVMRAVMDKNGASGMVAELDYFRFIDERESPDERTNVVEFRVTDGDTGGTTPCMVCIRCLDDETVRLPPDGRVQTKWDNFFDLEDGTPYDPQDRNWIGPVFRTAGLRINEGGDHGGMYPLDKNSIPFWAEPVMYQTTGNFSIRLPGGRFRIAVKKGMEYVPVVEEFEVQGRKTIEKRLELKRWIHLAKKGWYSGDTHVHHPTVTERDRQYLLEYCVAEDLHVSNILDWTHHYYWTGDGSESLFQVNGFGENFRANKGEYWLVSGQEDSNHFG